MTTKTHQISPLSTRAAVGTVNAEKRTVEIVWSTGAPVQRMGWDGPFIEELSMEPKAIRMGRFNSGSAPFLANHDSSRVEDTLGVIESARLENGKGVATVRFVAAGVDLVADQIFSKIQDKVIRNVSVGYRTHRLEKVVTGEGSTPVFRATDWEPFECSAVAIGADAAAGFRSSEATNICEVLTPRGSPQTQEHSIMTEEEKRAAEAKLQAEIAQRNAEIEAEVARRTLLARERDTGIAHACRTAKLGDEFAQKLVNDPKVSLDQARALVIDELARRDMATPTENHVRVTGVAGGDESDKFVRGVSAWLFEKSGNGLVEKAVKRGAKGFEKVELDGGQFRGMSLSDVARECCRRNNVSTAGVYDKRRLFELAIRAGGSTGDFAVLFENVMYKSMRAAYATQQDTWRRFCGTDTVQDFKASNRYLNGSFGTLPVVNENAEYQNIAIPDGSKLSITTETRGGIIGLSRQALINDDMGALVDVAVRFGMSAGKSIEAAVYAQLALNAGLGPTLADSTVFFDDSDHGNVSTGAALSVAALDLDRQKMRAQMDANSNDYLDLMPSILLVAPQLESAAKILNESAYDHTSALDQKPNAVKGMFSDIVSSPRITGTRRYLFTASKEAFKVVFLEGAGEGPTMESQDGFRVDGTEWKARIDFKVNPFDPKHGLTNAGA